MERKAGDRARVRRRFYRRDDRGSVGADGDEDRDGERGRQPPQRCRQRAGQAARRKIGRQDQGRGLSQQPARQGRSRDARGDAAWHDRHLAGGRGADRRHLRAGLPAAFAAVPLAEPPARVEGDGRPARRGAREEDGGEGPQGAVLRWRLGLPQRDVEQAPDQVARRHEGRDDPGAAVAGVHRHDEAARRQSGADALERGVPGAEAGHRGRDGSAGVSIVSDKYHEIGKYYSLTKHTYEPITWFTNLKNYSALPGDLKKALDAASKDACALDRKAELDSEAGDLETIRKAGVQVNDIADTKPFRDMMGPVYQEVGAKVGKEWLDKVLDAAK